MQELKEKRQKSISDGSGGEQEQSPLSEKTPGGRRDFALSSEAQGRMRQVTSQTSSGKSDFALSSEAQRRRLQ
jgi:hypothetical protein